jgi:hypothetical protein
MAIVTVSAVSLVTGGLATAVAGAKAPAPAEPPATAQAAMSFQEQTDGTVRAFVRVNPLRVELATHRQHVPVGVPVHVRAVVHNLGGQAVADVVATLSVEEAGLAIRDAPTVQLGDLRAGRRSRAQWQACAHEAGTYTLLVQVAAVAHDGQSIELDSDAVLLVVTPNNRACPPW